jgi:hypothetical protein
MARPFTATPGIVTTFVCPPGIYEKMKETCAGRHTSVRAFVTEAVTAHLARVAAAAAAEAQAQGATP